MPGPFSISVTSPATDFATFSVAHGLGRAPSRMPTITPTSGGSIWFDQATPYDASNFYLHASDAGVTAVIDGWIGPPSAGGAYTTLAQVCAMFPTFKRGIAQQNPSDTYIQSYINDVAGEIDAALQRRFGEAISNTPFSTWVVSLTLDAQNLLEKINRYGAAAQLAAVFESLGFTSLGKLAREYAEDYATLLLELNGWDDKGKPKPEGGIYDHLFDIEARTETPRPVLGGVAGAEEPRNTTDNLGMSNVFTKFGERGR